MEQLLLTPEEIKVCREQAGQDWRTDYERYYATEGAEEIDDVYLYISKAIAKAQLKKVAERGNERVECEHQVGYHKRIRCEGCWQDLRKEAESEE